MFDGILADGKRVAEQVRRRVDSVATRSSIASVESAPTAAASSITTKEEKYDDLDDFTSEHQPRMNEELLSKVPGLRSTMPMKLALKPYKERSFEPLSANSSEEKSNLIEFEA